MLLSALLAASFGVAYAAPADATVSNSVVEEVPAGKYETAPKKTVDEPAFVDSSSDTAAAIPVTAYVQVGVDLETNTPNNNVSLANNGAYATVGADMKVSPSWVLGGYVKHKSKFGGVNLPDGSATAASDELRLSAGWGSSFGLSNVIRIDTMSGDYGTGQEYKPVMRLENFTRYDTKYSKAQYQFASVSVRGRTDGGYNAEAVIGQGFRFSDRDTLELAAKNDFSQDGSFLANSGMLNKMNHTGMVSKQKVSMAYTQIGRAHV